MQEQLLRAYSNISVTHAEDDSHFTEVSPTEVVTSAPQKAHFNHIN